MNGCALFDNEDEATAIYLIAEEEDMPESRIHGADISHT